MKNNPLLGLVGTWKGDKGIDLAPKPEEDENNPYYEVLVIEPVDIEIENAEEQELLAVRYHQLVREKSNDKVSHDETGYWIWEKNSDAIICSFSIPRGVSLLCGGGYKTSEGETVIKVVAKNDDPDWGIVQSPFMKEKALTTSFERELTFTGKTLSYTQTTKVDIYGKKFDHDDSNTLVRVD